ncbi:hypothetical protein OH76DRAFT_510951 [Lentinus brumalis]|uniref:Uncharacterized protein n=1 Tax=Lentinus brumalis TaxID=2498619 RepID=A0A371DBB7_9APHY|nr:hypothetical protein OH76DRAFT_510951 [Polyporus brumalis]
MSLTTASRSLPEVNRKRTKSSRVLARSPLFSEILWPYRMDGDVADPILGFKLTIAGLPAKDLGRWLSEEVLRNDSLCEFAPDLAIVVKVRVCISTGRVFPRPSEDGTQSYDVPTIAGPGEPRPASEEPKVLYFYENFSTLRSEGAFEVPVGYWSTSPEDPPTEEEITRRGPHNEGRNIVYAGSTENGSTTWVQQLRTSDSGPELHFFSQTRRRPSIVYEQPLTT